MNKQEMQRCKIKSSGDGSQGQLMRITHDIVILLEFLILFFYRFIFLNPTEGDEGATLQFLLIKEERGGIACSQGVFELPTCLVPPCSRTSLDLLSLAPLRKRLILLPICEFSRVGHCHVLLFAQTGDAPVPSLSPPNLLNIFFFLP